MSSEVFLEISCVSCCSVWEFCTLLVFLLVYYVFQICIFMIFVYLCLYICMFYMCIYVLLMFFLLKNLVCFFYLAISFLKREKERRHGVG